MSVEADIFDGIAKARIAFLAANIKPPTVMLLESHEEGMRFLDAVRQTPLWEVSIGDPRLGMEVQMADGSIWMEVKIMDIAIRWPANRHAMPDGTWRHA